MIGFLSVLGFVVLISCLLGILFVSKNENLTKLMYKSGICESDMDDRLKSKEDLILRTINIINRQIKLDIKVFDEVKNIKVNKLNKYDKDKLLNSAFNEINKIYSDNPKLKEVKSFDGLIKDIEKLEIEMISLRTLYNKCACEFNNLHDKFPYNLICKFRKLKIKNLYEGRELTNEIEKELNFF